MPQRHKAMWKGVFKRNFTRESIERAVKSQNPDDLEEKQLKLSVCDSLAPFMDLNRVDRSMAYLEMAKNMPNASAGTLRKLRKRLKLE